MHKSILLASLIMITMTFVFFNPAMSAPPSSCSEVYARCVHNCETRPSGKPFKCRGFCPAELESCKATGNWYGLGRQWTGFERN
jgi:hypothetical protein